MSDASQMQAARARLRAAIADISAPPIDDAARILLDGILAKHAGAAALFYGSGASVSRQENPADIIYDFYVIGPSYEALFASPALRLANRLVPPNVFYFETPSRFGVLRAKYAVLSIDHFEELISRRTFHSYFWARFAQPCRIHAPDGALRERLETALEEACASFAHACAGLAGDKFTARELWLAGLGVSYKAELRAEDETRAAKLIASYGDWIDKTTAPALILAGLNAAREGNGVIALTPAPKAPSLAWRLRAVQGAALSVLRLLKGTQTFKGGIDYIAWKIKRHSGVDLAITDFERRHPLLGAPGAALRYYRLRAAQAGD